MPNSQAKRGATPRPPCHPHPPMATALRNSPRNATKSERCRLGHQNPPVPTPINYPINQEIPIQSTGTTVTQRPGTTPQAPRNNPQSTFYQPPQCLRHNTPQRSTLPLGCTAAHRRPVSNGSHMVAWKCQGIEGISHREARGSSNVGQCLFVSDASCTIPTTTGTFSLFAWNDQ